MDDEAGGARFSAETRHPAPIKNIAVIAVHGVADQEPGVTAREVADLLVRQDPSAGAFYEHRVRIAVDSVALPEPPLSRDELWAQGADFTFMYGQLTGDFDCEGDRRPEYLPRGDYDTVCLTRPDRAGGRTVHIHEMYWADLSRLSTSFGRIFGEFYQLLFHVSSLGRHVADEARDSALLSPSADIRAYVGKWKRLAKAQHLAALVLTLPIPILNLYLVALVATLAVGWLPLNHAVLGAGVIAMASVLVFGNLFYRWAPNAPYGVPFVFTGAAALLIFIALARYGPAGTWTPVSVAAWASVIGAALILMLRAYERYRPGALAWGGALAFITAGCLVAFMAQGGEADHILFRTIEAVCLALVLSWAVLLGCHCAVAVAGAVLKWTARKAAQKAPDETARAQYRDKVERVVWTGRLAVIMPTALFLVVTLSLWAAIAWFGGIVRPATSPISYTPLITELYASPKTFTSVRELGLDLVAGAASPLAAVSLVLMFGATALMVWAFFPCVVAEVRPPKNASDGTRLGEWLDSGLKLLRWSGRLVFISVVIVLPLAMIASIVKPADADWAGDILRWADAEQWGLPTARTIVAAVGAALAGTALTLVAAGGRLAKSARKIRPILDVALDVDNHLREHPLRANPRAKIAARYVSLLRHVCEWRGLQGERYDALVIVAHSQGTIITADLLRFIRTAALIQSARGGPQPNVVPIDPRLARIAPSAAANDVLPIHLMTVGCPLRQLYSLRFPDLYDWARHSVAGPWSAPPGVERIDHGPDPAELNVMRWVNGYRSGDYVGRYLWRPDLCNYRWGVPPIRSVSQNGDRIEFCIGAGAHTHYFDATAPQIGAELEDLIANAAVGAGSTIM